MNDEMFLLCWPSFLLLLFFHSVSWFSHDAINWPALCKFETIIESCLLSLVLSFFLSSFPFLSPLSCSQVNYWLKYTMQCGVARTWISKVSFRTIGLLPGTREKLISSWNYSPFHFPLRKIPPTRYILIIVAELMHFTVGMAFRFRWCYTACNIKISLSLRGNAFRGIW